MALHAQASFDPPGITIAVKKDRGMETMLQPGNTFAVSMVPERLEKPIMKVRGRAGWWRAGVAN